MQIELIEDAAGLAAVREGWEALALELATPFASPSWLLPWLEHSAPPDIEVRTVVMTSGSELLGVAPFFAQAGSAGRVDYRLFGAPFTQRREPLARPGHEKAFGEAIGKTLGAASPPPSLIALEAIEAGSRWPELMARSYPGPLRAGVARRRVQTAPSVDLAGQSFDDWLAGKSSNFRQQMGRARRKLENDGGRIRTSEADDRLAADIQSFLDLHLGRWEGRGGSALETERNLDRMLLDVARELVPQGRFRLVLVEMEDRPIGAGLFLAAGGQVAYFNGGFDDEFARYKPTILAILRAVEDGCERGDRSLDLGGGAQPYKLRFSDGDAPLTWATVRPRNAHSLPARRQVLKDDLRWYPRALAMRLPSERQEQVKAFIGRLGGGE